MYRAMEARGKHRLRRLVCVLVVVCALVCAGLAISHRVQADMTDQATSSLRRAVLDGAVQCYAIEGAYPSSVEYLEENYGL